MRASLVATVTALWLALVPTAYAAKTTPEQAIDKAEAQFLQTEFDAAIDTLSAAIANCDPATCTKKQRASLHMTMGLVQAAGKKRLDDAKDSFMRALDLDPEAKPEPELSTEEVEYAFKKAREQLGLTEKPAPQPAPAKPVPAKPAPQPKPEPDEDEEVFDDDPNVNWIHLSFGWDFSILSSEDDVCVPARQNETHIVCVREDETRYTGTPQLGTGDNVNGGPIVSTPRLMLGYDRILFDNFSVGARVGIAFLGMSKGDASFLPVHLEARVAYWFRERPFELAQVRPYVMLSGGLAQIDSKLDVEVREDPALCQPDSTGKCTQPTSADPNRREPAQQSLAVAKQAGLGFAAGTLGLGFAPIPLMMIGVGVRVSVTFPVVTPVLTPELTVAFGLSDNP